MTDRTPVRPATVAERAIERRRAAVMPLERFPPEHRARIAAQVAAPEPPPRFFPVGGDSPRPLAWLPSRGWYEWHWSRGIDPEAKREPLPYGTREAVIARDGYVCGLCGGDVEPDDIHIDHVKPYSKGGDHRMSNLQVAHSLCNLRKGARV